MQSAVRRHLHLATLVCAGLFGGATLLGCDHTLSAKDCQRIGKHLREVWDTDSAAAASSSNDRAADLARSVIRSRGDRLVSEWKRECSQTLIGKRISQEELNCIMRAQTLPAVQACAQGSSQAVVATPPGVTGE